MIRIRRVHWLLGKSLCALQYAFDAIGVSQDDFMRNRLGLKAPVSLQVSQHPFQVVLLCDLGKFGTYVLGGTVSVLQGGLQ